ncbi:MAG: leucyl/phenylalanyl-tRNA--protein transferase [Burkholderiales bacterium]|jgi:leucyl/phenylalanyl-tRNA--protein transferase
MLTWVDPGRPLPPPSKALQGPNGLLAAGRDLSPERLLEAYGRGIFPWYSAGQPVLWWSPDPRMVLFIDEFKLSRSLAKTLRRVRRDGSWTVALDRDFEATMLACAEPRPDQDGTWITPLIRQAYVGLHRLGHAHSVEVLEDGVPVGGLYGVSIGRMFFGESMFTRRPDASKCALASLVGLLREHGFSVIDCQQATAHLASLGGREIPRDAFLDRVATLAAQPPPDWSAMRLEFPDV